MNRILFADHLLKSFSVNGKYCSNEYPAVFNLLTHLRYRNPLETLSLTLNATFILQYLYSGTSFFKEVGDISYNDVNRIYEDKDAIFIGKLVAHHIMLLQMNSIAVNYNDQIQLNFVFSIFLVNFEY